MAFKIFAERLNQELDNMGVPQHDDERVEAFRRLIDTQKFKAASILHGEIMPSPEILDKIAKVLEVDIDWLVGKNDSPAH